MSASFKTALAESLRPPSLVWLELVLTVTVGEPDYERFRARLLAFLRGSGVAGVLAGERLALVGTPGPVRAEDKALVMHWLIQQPQVVLIAVRRASESSEGQRHG